MLGQVCWHLMGALRLVVPGAVPACCSPGKEVAPYTRSNYKLSFLGVEAGEGWDEGRSRQRGCVPALGACGNRRCWKKLEM